MSDTDPQTRIRLVSLALTPSGTPRPKQDVDRAFEFAMGGEVRLYAALPPGKKTYVNPGLRVVTKSDRGHTTHKVDGSSAMADYSDRADLIQPDVTYVALDPDHVKDLRTLRRAEGSTFPSGLAPHPIEALARDGWMVPRQFPSSLDLCSAAEAAEGRTRTMADRTGGITISYPTGGINFEPMDILVDERDIALLENQQASDRDDPYHLQDRSPGVFVLYCAAERYYEQLEREEVTREDVAMWVSKQLPDLYGKTYANRAVKLIHPDYSRTNGLLLKDQRPLDPAILSRQKFRDKYLKPTFVNEPLALTIYVTHWWLTECKKSEIKRKPKIRPTRTQVEKKLDEIGFYQKEREALTRIVMWPDR